MQVFLQLDIMSEEAKSRKAVQIGRLRIVHLVNALAMRANNIACTLRVVRLKMIDGTSNNDRPAPTASFQPRT
ncbi:MAG: hypothetical protein CMB79_00530 [Filomicrobium sp.]|nr:hypothetical protein [Filomicrobium sp.]